MQLYLRKLTIGLERELLLQYEQLQRGLTMAKEILESYRSPKFSLKYILTFDVKFLSTGPTTRTTTFNSNRKSDSPTIVPPYFHLLNYNCNNKNLTLLVMLGLAFTLCSSLAMAMSPISAAK